MTVPGLGGQQPPPQNAAPAGQLVPGIQAGTTAVFVQLRAGNTIINGNGVFTYSGTPAAGNLIASQTGAAGVDQFGNNYLNGSSTYTSFGAAQLEGSDVQFYIGSLAGGWTLKSQIISDSLGDLSLTSGGSLSLFANSGTADLSASGGATVNGSANTGEAATDATTSTTSGNFNGGTLTTHNHSHGHTHPL